LLHSLVSSLRALLVMKGPLFPTSLSFKRTSCDDSNVLGAEFATTRSNVADFIAHLGSLALSCHGKLEPEEAQAVEVGIDTMFLASVRGVRIFDSANLNFEKVEKFDSNPNSANPNSNWQIGIRFARIVVVQNSFMNNSKARSNIRE
jgi:hypothetical protein